MYATSTNSKSMLKTRLRRRTDPWRMAAAALAAATAVSTVVSFTPVTFPLHRRISGWTARQQQSNNNSNNSKRSNISLGVLADPDMLLRETIRRNDNDEDDSWIDDISRLYHGSPSSLEVDNHTVIDELERFEKKLALSAIQQGGKNIEGADNARTKKQRRRVAMKRKATVLSKKSRSSTMPGFGSLSDRQRGYEENIRYMEQQTGRSLRETPEEERKRAKSNGTNMYKNSASVPDSLVQFAEEIHQQDRITRQEEIELGTKTQEAIRLQSLYDVLEAKLDREPTDEEWCAAAGKINMQAISEAIEEGIEAKNKLVTSNLRMVQSVVNTYIRNGLSGHYNAGDLMQEGIMALIRAAEKFEPDRGWKFSTYAMYWVRASVKRSQVYQSRVITVPQRLYENHKRLKKLERDIYLSTGKKPSHKELGKLVGMSELQVDRCYTAMQQRCYSLDQQVHNKLKPMKEDGGEDTLINVVESRTVDKENNTIESIYLRQDLIETLNRYLTPEEVEILSLRFGLKDTPTSTNQLNNRQVTIAELSRIVGLKPDKVRRIINNSLKQLKGAGMEEWLAFERDL